VAGNNITYAIMNPDNGPGAQISQAYVTAMSEFQAAGGYLFGYVYSCCGGSCCKKPRTVAQIASDALKYEQWYGPMTGIFVDEMSSSVNALPFYQELIAELRNIQPKWQIIGNSGDPAPVQYLSLFDVIVTAEGSEKEKFPVASWAKNYTPYRQANIRYSTTKAEISTMIALSESRNVGYVYITDRGLPNPYGTLPTYFTQLVVELI